MFGGFSQVEAEIIFRVQELDLHCQQHTMQIIRLRFGTPSVADPELSSFLVQEESTDAF